MLIAVLEQHAQLEMNDKDIYTSTVGGLKLIEPAVDLAVCTAMMSGAMNIVLPSNMCAIGEVGLGGEIRSVPQIEQRIAQASRRGYKSLLVPITQEKMGGSGCIGMASIGALGAFLQKNANIAQSKMQLSDGEKKRFTECY